MNEVIARRTPARIAPTAKTRVKVELFISTDSEKTIRLPLGLVRVDLCGFVDRPLLQK